MLLKSRKHLTVFPGVLDALRPKPFSSQKSKDAFSLPTELYFSLQEPKQYYLCPKSLSCWCEATFLFYNNPPFLSQNSWSRANEWLPGQNPTGDSRLVTGSTLSNSLFLWDEGFFPGGSHVTHVINSGRRASPVMLRCLDTIYAQAVPTTPHSTPQ